MKTYSQKKENKSRLIPLFTFCILQGLCFSIEKTNECNNYDISDSLFENLSYFNDQKSQTINLDNSHKDTKATIYLKGCSNDTEIEKKCGFKMNEIGVIFGNDASDKFFCEPLSKNGLDHFTSTEWNLFYIDRTKDDLDELDQFPLGKKGAKFIANNIDYTNLGYDVELNVICPENLETTSNPIAQYDKEKNLYTVTMHNERACSNEFFVPPKVTYNQALEAGKLDFIDQLGWAIYIVCPAICLLSLYQTFLGQRFYKLNSIVIGFLAGLVTCYLLLGSIVSENSATGRWIVLAISLVGGIGIAVLFHCLEQVALIGAGGFLGAVLAQFLYNLVIYQLDILCGGPYFYWITLVQLACLFGWLAHKLETIVWVLATSICGAYMAVKSIGKMIGNYPDESSFVDELKNGHTSSITVDHWIYFGVSCAQALTGVLFQLIWECKRTKAEQETNLNNQFSQKNDSGMNYQNMNNQGNHRMDIG